MGSRREGGDRFLPQNEGLKFPRTGEFFHVYWSKRVQEKKVTPFCSTISSQLLYKTKQKGKQRFQHFIVMVTANFKNLLAI